MPHEEPTPITAIPQTTPLWVTFPHLGRTYQVIGWERHNGYYSPIIINTLGPHMGLGTPLRGLGGGAWPVTFTTTPPEETT